MSTLKQNPLANLIKAAVGFQTSSSGCCGPRAPAIHPSTQPATAPVEKKEDASCGCSAQAASIASDQDTGATGSQRDDPMPGCCG